MRQQRNIDLASYAKPYVTANALAEYLNVDRRTIVRMIAAGALAGIKVGRVWRISTASAREAFKIARAS